VPGPVTGFDPHAHHASRRGIPKHFVGTLPRLCGKMTLTMSMKLKPPDHRNYNQRGDHDQRDHGRGPTITAVPYATISVSVSPISDESKRIATTAFAPMRRAFSTIRSMACRRLSSSNSVY